MKKIFRFFLWIIILGILAVGGYWVYLNYFNKQVSVDAFNLVPQETFFIIQTDNLTEAWTELSNTPLWQQLIKTKYFEEWNEDIEYVDKFLDSNKIANYLLSGRQLIMAAVTAKKDWDFLYIVDLSKASKAFSDFQALLKFLDGYEVKTEKYKINDKDYEIISLKDLAYPEDILYIAVANNILLATYTKDALLMALKEQNDEHWKKDADFQEIIKENPGKKLAKVFVNYKMLNKFFGYYLTEEDETFSLLSEALKFSNLDLAVEEDKLVLEGLTTVDTASAYLQALMSVKPARCESFRIMTNQTAAFISMSFDDFSEFYHNLMDLYKKLSPDYAKTTEKTLNFLKNTFNIDIERDLIQWIGEEVAIYKIRPISQSSRAEDIALVIKTNDINLAKSGLDNIIKKIKAVTPFKFKEINYKNFTINYLKQKAIFGAIFGKMFDKIEKPYYTFINDYVVFTNSLELLEQIIDDYVAGRTLDKNENFRDFIDAFGVRNTFSVFIQMPKMYPTLYKYTEPDDRKDLEENKDLIMSFSYIGFRLVSLDKGFKTLFMTQYDPDAPVDDQAELLSIITENQSFTEFIDTQGYKIEIPISIRQEGTYREYYDPDTTKLKLEGNITDGKMNGVWRMYYLDGKLKASLNYSEDQLNGVAYFYYDNPENNLRAEMNFTENKPDGVYKEYYENGANKAILFYKEGQLDGEAEYFYENGALKIKGKYKNGKKDGKWIYYDKAGNIIKKEKWKKGELKKTKEL